MTESEDLKAKLADIDDQLRTLRGETRGLTDQVGGDGDGSGGGTSGERARPVPGSGAPAEPEPVEDIDLDDLVDAAPGSVPTTLDRLAQAFPGAELIEGGA